MRCRSPSSCRRGLRLAGRACWKPHKLAVDPVQCEPVSGSNSLLTGKFTGSLLREVAAQPQEEPANAVPRASCRQFEAQWIREFLATEQGDSARGTGSSWGPNTRASERRAAPADVGVTGRKWWPPASTAANAPTAGDPDVSSEAVWRSCRPQGQSDTCAPQCSTSVMRLHD